VRGPVAVWTSGSGSGGLPLAVGAASRWAPSEPSEDRTGLGQRMITGANTNVRYRGILFHVQTEDSGRANPHIISHVYHGGTILGTHKTDYSHPPHAHHPP